MIDVGEHPARSMALLGKNPELLAEVPVQMDCLRVADVGELHVPQLSVCIVAAIQRMVVAS